MPSVKIRRMRENKLETLIVPLTTRWDEVDEQINKDTPQAKKHRESLFGHDSNIKTGGLFSEIALCKRDGMPSYHEFRILSLNDRARYLAFATIDSMKELIERHESMLKKNKEAQLAKQRNANKGKKRRK